MDSKLQGERQQMEIDMKKIKDVWQAKLLSKKDEFKENESKMESQIRSLQNDLGDKIKQMQDLRQLNMNAEDSLEQTKDQLEKRIDEIEKLQRECTSQKNDINLQRMKNEELQSELKQ